MKENKIHHQMILLSIDINIYQKHFQINVDLLTLYLTKII
jgi:hypothetical protein